jgi:hypothetical protein
MCISKGLIFRYKRIHLNSEKYLGFASAKDGEVGPIPDCSKNRLAVLEMACTDILS